MTNANSPQFVAVILAAGSGSRMKSSVRKQYLKIADKILVNYSIEAFLQSGMEQIVLVVPENDIDYIKDNILPSYDPKRISIISGGITRTDSVENAIRYIEKKNFQYVLIHDGARPFVSQELITRIKTEVIEHQAVIAAVPEKNTIHQIDENGFSKGTIDRNTLWAAQTPQAFAINLMTNAYDLRNKEQEKSAITDDASLIHMYLGIPAKIIMGEENNIKITTPEDLILGEMIEKEIRRSHSL